MKEDIKNEDVPEILRGLKAIEDDAIKRISEGKRMLAKVRKAKKEILLKYGNENCTNDTKGGKDFYCETSQAS